MAASTAGGRPGSKAMVPAASTPVETVTMAARASIGPAAVSTVMVRPARMRWTGARRRIGRPSARRATRVPKPSASCGFSPSRPVSM